MDAATLTGRTLGHYVVLDKIGEGGMGVVYKGRDLRLGRLAALKVLARRAFADDTGARRFAQEARAASSLNHPNIVTVYEIDRADDVDFIAMELVDGRTLSDMIADGRVGVDEKLRLASQVADALVAAHGAGIVHRDLKPSNIMVTRDGRAKVLDFGLARSGAFSSSSVETTNALTTPGTIVGTVAYMSPEQASGRPADGRSDIFSFGCVLYELVSGCRAFGGASNVDVLASLLRDRPTPIPDAPAGLMRVIERCLSKDPGARYQSASDLRAALASCRTAGEVAHPESIAVLPLANLGGGPDDDYLCEGLAEAIIGALTGVDGLSVIARTSAFAVARQGLDAREIGVRLGVAHVLEGSVRRAGPRVRVSVRLVRAADGTDVWSERYDHEAPDVFALEDAISAAVSRRLRGAAGGGRIGPRAAVDPEARKAYLEGRYHFARGGPVGLARAKTCFESALARDPDFALACDSLAEVYWFLGFFGVMPPREAFSQSTWHALRALELDDALAETHALLGMLRKELDYNWPEVHREIRRALDLNPASPVVRLRHAISGLIPLARLDEAVAEVTRALEVDPLSIDARWWLGCLHWLARRPERTVEIGRAMIDLDPMSFWSHLTLGFGLGDCGALDEAAAEMERASEVSGGAALAQGLLGHFHGRAGRRTEALATLERLRQAAAGRYLPPFSVALIHIGLGDWDEAFGWMDRAVEERDPIIIPIKSIPYLDPVRSDPRYTALLRRMNLA